MSFTDFNNQQQVKQAIDNKPQSNDPTLQVSAEISLGGIIYPDVTVKEVIVGESLLNPSAHVAVTLQSAIYTPQTQEAPFFNIMKNKDWNSIRGQEMKLFIHDKDPTKAREMRIRQKIYRIDNRHFSNLNTGQVEDLTVHSIDDSILKDAKKLMEGSWKCDTPTKVVKEALSKIGVDDMSEIMESGPARPYVAEMIHPLQVIQQQANVAMDGDDPSFLHYMTINQITGDNVHHFKPLKKMFKASPYDIYAADTAVTGGTAFSQKLKDSPYGASQVAVTFSFPCDFDLLSDLLNGVDENGKTINGVATMNFGSGVADLASAVSGVLDMANRAFSITNLGTAGQQKTCETNVEKHLQLRQARMGLLDRDKIALRITVPWSPWLHAGDMINFHWFNRFNQAEELYGSGQYLIAHMTHNIQYGGYAVTNLDCIANTFGRAK